MEPHRLPEHPRNADGHHDSTHRHNGHVLLMFAHVAAKGSTQGEPGGKPHGDLSGDSHEAVQFKVLELVLVKVEQRIHLLALLLGWQRRRKPGGDDGEQVKTHGKVCEERDDHDVHGRRLISARRGALRRPKEGFVGLGDGRGAGVTHIGRAIPPLERTRTTGAATAHAAAVALVAICREEEQRDDIGHNADNLHYVGLQHNVRARAAHARVQLVIVDDVGEQRLRDQLLGHAPESEQWDDDKEE
eukprot:7384775-Prymnesium_polylepis.1